MTENTELNTYLERIEDVRNSLDYATKDVLNVLEHGAEAIGALDNEALNDAITDINYATSNLIHHALHAQRVLLQARNQQ